MAKKDSLLGSIIKGTVDLTASTIKTAYDAAEEIAKVGYEVATSKQAKEIYKKTGSVVGDLLRFTPPKDKISKQKFIHCCPTLMVLDSSCCVDLRGRNVALLQGVDS